MKKHPLYSAIHAIFNPWRLALGFGALGLLPLTSPAQASCVPKPSGLVSWWRAEGNANDSVDGANGTLYGGVTFAAGKVGQSFSFDGVNGAVNVPDVAALALTNSLTIEGWVFVTNAPSTPGMIIFRGDTRSGLDPYYISVEPQAGTSGKLNFVVWGADNIPAFVNCIMPVGNWTHVAGTLDDATGLLRLYTNGVVAAETNTTVRPLGPLDPASHPGIGIGNHSSQPGQFNYAFRGLIDELSVYNRALSASEIQGIYGADSAGKCIAIAPSIVSQPVSQTVFVNDTVSFSVTAAGDPPLSYQWQFNGAGLIGQTSTSLTLTNVQFGDAGDYSVVVSNVTSSVVSSNALLTVNARSCFARPSGLVSWWRAEGNANDSVDGANGTLYGGVTFTTGKVGQAFSFNGVNGAVNVPDIAALALTNSLTIEGWVFVTNAPSTPGMIIFRGDTRSGLDPYYISVEPQAGTSGKLNFVIYGAANIPAYINCIMPVGNWTHVAGTLDDATGLMSLYTNGVVAAQTNTTVRPLGPLNPSFHPGVGIGNHSSQPGPFNYAFRGLIDELAVYNRALSAAEIQGIYGADSAGKCTAIAPSIVSQPVSQTVFVNDTVSFSVTAAGDPPLGYQWRFNGAGLIGQTSTSLTLTNVQFGNAGNYSVVVSNGGGSVVSSNALLTVNPRPCFARPSGLVSWWRAEGNANDSVDGANGTLYGGVTFAVGKVGQSFSFNGVNGAINVPDIAALALTNSLTIEGWVFVTNAPSTPGMIIFRGDTRSGLDPYYISVEPQAGTSGKLNFVIYGADNIPAYVNCVMPVGNWTHVAGTLDDATGLLRLYTNGVVAAETNTTVRPLGPLNPAYHPGVGIGNHSSQPGPFNYAFRGLIDELSVYNRALSASEIQGIYGADSGGKCFHTPPIAADMTAATYKNQAMSIPIPKLLLFASDPDGDPLSLASVSANSTNGGGVVVSGNVVTYTPVPGFIGADRFTWTVSDGDSTASAFVLIQVRNSDGISQNMLPLTATANGYRVSFAGIPGRSYTIQRAPSVTGPWTTLTTVTAGPDGIGSYEDTNPLPGSAFYRTVYP